MKLACFDANRLGAIVDDYVVDITEVCGVNSQEWPPTGMVRTIAAFEQLRGKIEAAMPSCARHKVGDVTLRTPIAWPNKVIAFPVNYHDHGKEMQADYRATHQGFFLKPASSLSGADEPIVLPNTPNREIHHECEMAIIIGKQGKDIAAANWQEHVFGYACLLDMVVRGREERVARKAYDTFCPVGPWITTSDEIADPANIEMKLWVGDELRQHANTRDLVLDIPGMIEMASAVMTLYPGDIIATGTPAGVGPVQAGDVIRISLDGLGQMNVPVVNGQGGGTFIFDKEYVPPIIKQVKSQ
jgi:2-keto-4-pentenoate hydratase/2-oxohepta-3-ene-1,7-dioic acid hydratase in catechol pathway